MADCRSWSDDAQLPVNAHVFSLGQGALRKVVKRGVGDRRDFGTSNEAMRELRCLGWNPMGGKLCRNVEGVGLFCFFLGDFFCAIFLRVFFLFTRQQPIRLRIRRPRLPQTLFFGLRREWPTTFWWQLVAMGVAIVARDSKETTFWWQSVARDV
jgi:hypothetical protein